MTDRPARIVETGYDAIADDFAAWQRRIVGDPRRSWIDRLASRLEDGARVLELGCGAGVPDARLLSERFRLTGVDISREQIARARTNVPAGRFIRADLTTIEFEPGSFDAVLAVYVLNHVPRALLAGLLGRIHAWLTSGGFLLASFGTGDTDSWLGQWLGTEMFFSSFPRETTIELLQEAGFEVLRDELEPMREPEGEVEFHWVFARR